MPWLGVLLLLLGTDPSAQDAAPASADVTAPLVDQHFTQTEAALRPASMERLLLLAHELSARGLDQAALDLRARIPPQELAQSLLALGQAGAARAVIEQWRQTDPNAEQAILLDAVALYAEGSLELSLRVLDQSPPPAAGAPPLARTLAELIRYQQLRGVPAGGAGNPWNVTFHGKEGSFAAGQLADAERAKIPPGTTRAVMELSRLLPTSAATWGLLGELLNADGFPAGARTAFARARSLGYTPRWLLDHDRILAAAERATQAELDARLGSASTPPAQAADAPALTGGWSELGDRPRVLMVVIVGAVFALVILTLQLRQWIRPRRNSSKGP